MQKLGDAFLGKQTETMDAIQRLRAKARAAGNLKPNEPRRRSSRPSWYLLRPAVQLSAPQQQTIIRIEPANPQVIYVPT